MITSYTFGRIEVDGRVYTSDIILLPSGVMEGWWRKEGHALCLDDIKPVIDAKVEVLVVGRGESGMMRIRPEVEKALSGLGIELISGKTAEACKTFNDVSANRKAAAALHLTC
ncbi:MAG: Mth938-like domain-containing protein [Deltaproteobacteria bacterium]|nr:Mth938-like domain-containing protein [Deltaproteobacteria bacterium]